MATERRSLTYATLIVAAMPLTWPAFWNRYPLVFADTGSYLSQAIEHHIGWDRPVFYSLLVFPLHLGFSTWPIVAAQAALTVYTLHLVRRLLVPDAGTWAVLLLTSTLAAATTLPWFVSQIMPDLLTPLMVLLLAVLILAPDKISRVERLWLLFLTTAMIAAHLSNVPLSIGIALLLLPLRRWFGCRRVFNGRDLLLGLAPSVLAVTALIAVNAAAFGRLSAAPFGNVFLLARVIYDGPGMTILRRDCPESGWLLCSQLERFPENADDFLWRADSPLIRAGGAKLVSAEANAIIISAWLAQPARAARALIVNSAQQLGDFATGAELQAWPQTVTPVIERDFPNAEHARYEAALQTRGLLTVPGWLQAIHCVIGLACVTACVGLVWFARYRLIAGFALAVLAALLINAAITGGLSGPHDRYQSRMMWLPPAIALLGVMRWLPGDHASA